MKYYLKLVQKKKYFQLIELKKNEIFSKYFKALLYNNYNQLLYKIY